MTSPTPEQAREALAAIRRQQHASIDAAFKTPGWYFFGLAGLLVFFGAVYLTNDWVEKHVSFAVAVVVFLLGLVVFAAGMGALVALVAVRAKATPRQAYVNGLVTTKEAIIGAAVALVTLIAAWGVAYAITGVTTYSTVVVLAIVAVASVVGGRPLQRLFRERAHRNLDRAESAR